jgi:hypothetical protein
MRKPSAVLMKSLAALLLTLTLGIVVGAALTGFVVQKRQDNARAFASADGFTLQLIEVLEPLSDTQRAAIKPLVKQAGADIEVSIKQTRRNVYNVMEHLEQNLANHLDDTQLNRLKDQRVKVRDRYKRND